ncbi:MAG: FAD-binding protein, partial [candidate division Zixibacteria bacterium]|nr:FAD-binding protein [candidate division Zixibacteria bacterium]
MGLFPYIFGMMTVGKSSRRLDKAATALREQFGEMILSNQSLTSFNTFGTGGNAGLFAEIKTIEELSTIVQAATELGIPFFMIGGGSNILVSDNGYDGLIIKNSIMGLTLDDTGIIAGAGERLQALVDFAAENCLTGLEFATGIWGTVGGAIYGNAGAYGSETGTIVESAQLVDRQGKVRTEQASYLEFGYRTSRLKKTGEFIARAKFALNMGNRDTIQTKIDEIKALRRE